MTDLATLKLDVDEFFSPEIVHVTPHDQMKGVYIVSALVSSEYLLSGDDSYIASRLRDILVEESIPDGSA